jgi:hypothetical protein
MRFAIFAAALLLALPALAEEGPCKDDVKKFCGSVKPGGGAIVECMLKHEAELTAPCKAKVAERKAKKEERAKKKEERAKKKEERKAKP